MKNKASANIAKIGTSKEIKKNTHRLQEQLYIISPQ